MNGIICIDKPQGFTSFDVIAKLRGASKFRKIGHSGTLDPMATGVLPLFFGRAAKACDLMPEQDKSYRATFLLGQETDTYDSTGRVTATAPVPPLTEAQLRAVCAQFEGEISQVPPMYSAVQKNGVRLYDLARQGIEVERAARRITVSRLELLAFDGAHFTVDIDCSKGTYVRSLGYDIGRALGCGACMTALVRTCAAGFTLSDCVTLEQAVTLAAAGELEGALRPVDGLFAVLPPLVLTERQRTLFCNGVTLDLHRIETPPAAGDVRVYGPDGAFLGLATAQPETGELRLKKLL